MKVTKRGLLRGALSITLVLLILNLALLWVANRSLRRALAGAPDLRPRLSDFAPSPIPQFENASNYMNAAGELCSLSLEEMRSLAIRPVDGESRSEPPPAGVWRQILRRNALALEILDKGAPLQRAWFETSASAFGAHWPPLQQRRCLASTLRARALLAAHEGRLTAAYQDVPLILRLGDWCSQESPVLISGLISVALTNTGLETLEQVMSSGAPEAETRRVLGERLAEARRADPIRRGLEGERTFHFQMAEAIADGTAALPSAIPGAPPAFPLLLLRFPFRFYLRLEQAASLRAISTFIARCARSTFELGKAGEADVAIPPWLPITRIAVPSLQRAVLSRDDMRARIDLGQIALDAEGYRESHGSYPSARIETWSKANRIDPVTGSPYAYEVLPNGFTLSGPKGRYTALSWTVASPGVSSAH